VVEGISLVCLVYDEIYEAGSFFDRATSHEVPILETFSWPEKWLVEILHLTYHEKKRYRDFSDRLHAAARTSIGGVGYGLDMQLTRIGDGRFLDAIVLLQTGVKYIKGKRMKLGLEQLLANRDVRDGMKSRIEVQMRLGSEIIGKSLGRLPFITKKGHLVLSAEYVKQGDSVALIQGAQVPFILRRQNGGQYQLISEAYVDGIMDGEAMETSKCSNITLV